MLVKVDWSDLIGCCWIISCKKNDLHSRTLIFGIFMETTRGMFITTEA